MSQTFKILRRTPLIVVLLALAVALSFLISMPAASASKNVYLTFEDGYYTVFSDTTFDGNITTDESWEGMIIVEEGVNFDGNIEAKGESGDFGVIVTVGEGNRFDGNITSKGAGSVFVDVLEGGLFNGNVKAEGTICNVTGEIAGNLRDACSP